MNKIIYITTFALTPQIERYLLIMDAIKAGFEVEYWDLKGIYFKNRPFKNVLLKEYSKEINSFKALKIYLKKEDLTDTVFVLQVNFEWQSLSLYRLMTRFGCKIVFFPWVTHLRRNLTARVIDRLRPDCFYQSILSVIAKIAKKIGLIKNYDLVFVAGQLTKDVYKNCTRVVDINYQDYDRYQEVKNNSEQIVSGEYCVFLDEGCVDNPNVKILKMEELNPLKFYGTLSRFFDAIEKKFNLKVVIAAHPGINYDKSIFGGREIYEGKTCELVKDCRFVISQASTSTSFAVFFKKPIILVYTDEYAIKRRVNFRVLEFLSRELGVKSYNMDLRKDVNVNESFKIRTDLYEKYKYTSFASPESEDKRSRDIVVKTLKEL